jgi:hypothetical protein
MTEFDCEVVIVIAQSVTLALDIREGMRHANQ